MRITRREEFERERNQRQIWVTAWFWTWFVIQTVDGHLATYSGDISHLSESPSKQYQVWGLTLWSMFDPRAVPQYKVFLQKAGCRDRRGWDLFRFRAYTNTRSSRGNGDASFRVAEPGDAGHAASYRVGDYSEALQRYCNENEP